MDAGGGAADVWRLLVLDETGLPERMTDCVGMVGKTCRPLCTGGVAGGAGSLFQNRPTSRGRGTVTDPSSVREHPVPAVSVRPVSTVNIILRKRKSPVFTVAVFLRHD